MAAGNGKGVKFTVMDPNYACLIRSMVLAAQALGLGSAWLARRSEGSPEQTFSQGFFVVSLLLVGAATIAAMGLGPGAWLASGTTFSVMVVTATCDLRRNTAASLES
jgi:hypothetical protein